MSDVQPDSPDEAMALLAALGPVAQPHPATLQVVNMTSTEGKRYTVLVVSDPTGRRAIWLEPEKATEWATLIGGVAAGASAAPPPLTVARQMPRGMPAPGSSLLPPQRGRLN